MSRKLLFLLSFILPAFFVAAQEEDERVFTKIEIEANTDTKQWNQHIQRFSKLPDSIQRRIPDGTYKIDVQFVITKLGDMSSVKAKNNPGYGLSRIAEGIIKGYKGKWKPANQCGREVTAYRTQQIVFVVNNQKRI